MKQPHKPVRSGEGFTMIELLVTMLLLTVALVGLAALQLYNIRQVTGSRQANEATRLGAAVLERYMSLPNGTVPSPASPVDWEDEPLAGGSGSMTNVAVDGLSQGPFTVRRLIEDFGTPTVRMITVRVRWLQHTPGATPAPNTTRTLEVMMSTQRTP